MPTFFAKAHRGGQFGCAGWMVEDCSESSQSQGCALCQRYVDNAVIAWLTFLLLTKRSKKITSLSIIAAWSLPNWIWPFHHSCYPPFRQKKFFPLIFFAPDLRGHFPPPFFGVIQWSELAPVAVLIANGWSKTYRSHGWQPKDLHSMRGYQVGVASKECIGKLVLKKKHVIGKPIHSAGIGQ